MKILVSLLLINLCLPAATQAENFAAVGQLKSLFTTPSQRQQLDKLRDAGKFTGMVSEREESKPIFREPLKVEMRGVLIKDGKPPVVWVNKGNTLQSKTIEEGVRVRPQSMDADSKKVPVNIFDRSYRMKPGEVWTESDNRVQDGYQIK